MITDKYRYEDNMIKCDRCGAEIEEHFFLNYIHSNFREDGRFILCDQCLIDFKEFIKNTNTSVSFNIPDGYNIVKGGKN